MHNFTAYFLSVSMTLFLSACGKDQTERPRMDSMPNRAFQTMLSGEGPEFVGHTDLAWKNKQTLTIAFERTAAPNDDLFELIEDAANEWVRSGGGLRFDFRDNDGGFRTWPQIGSDPIADIRIGFRDDRDYGGYWSALGTLARKYRADEPTMNLEGMNSGLEKYYNGANQAEWRERYEYSTILHEFGHALGLAHEHYHDACQADMIKDKVVRSLMGPPDNWKKEVARFNVITSVYLSELYKDGSIVENPISSTLADRRSIMLYHGESENYRSRENSPCLPLDPLGFATELSAGDREYFVSLYP